MDRSPNSLELFRGEAEHEEDIKGHEPMPLESKRSHGRNGHSGLVARHLVLEHARRGHQRKLFEDLNSACLRLNPSAKTSLKRRSRQQILSDAIRLLRRYEQARKTQSGAHGFNAETLTDDADTSPTNFVFPGQLAFEQLQSQMGRSTGGIAKPNGLASPPPPLFDATRPLSYSQLSTVTRPRVHNSAAVAAAAATPAAVATGPLWLPHNAPEQQRPQDSQYHGQGFDLHRDFVQLLKDPRTVSYPSFPLTPYSPSVPLQATETAPLSASSPGADLARHKLAATPLVLHKAFEEVYT